MITMVDDTDVKRGAKFKAESIVYKSVFDLQMFSLLLYQEGSI